MLINGQQMQTYGWLYNIENIYIDDANNNRIQKFVTTTSDQEESKQCFLPIINYIIIQRKKIWIISLLFVYTLACEEHKKIFWSSWLADIINFCFSLMKHDQLLDYIWRRKCYLQKNCIFFIEWNLIKVYHLYMVVWYQLLQQFLLFV